MTLPQVQELLAYWHAHPPLHLLLAAAYVLQETRTRDEDFAALMALAPDGLLRAKGKA
jgi:hypothetical protein